LKHVVPEAVDASVIRREGEIWSCDIFAAFWRLPKNSMSGFPEQAYKKQQPILAQSMRRRKTKGFVHTYDGRKSLIVSTFTVVFHP